MALSQGFPPNLFGDGGVVGQKAVAITGTAVQLTSGSNKLLNGLLITNNGSTTVTVGFSSGVTNTADGSGNGYILAAGATTSVACTNTNQVYINGTATTSYVSFMGS